MAIAEAPAPSYPTGVTAPAAQPPVLQASAQSPAPINFMQGEQARAGGDNNLSPTAANYGFNPQSPMAPPTQPTPTPFTAPPTFMTPALQQYVNQFRQSQAAQQQAMNAGLVQALQGLGERRDAASKVAAQLPAQYEQAYQQATQAGQAAANTAGAALNLGKGVPAASAVTQQAAAGDLGANAAVNAAGREAGVAGQPLLQAGITADYSKGANTLQNTNMQNQAAVDQQQAAFDQQMALAQASYEQNVNMANLQSSLGVQAYKAENPNAALTPQQTVALQNQQAMDTSAQKAGFTDYSHLQQALTSPAYTYALSVLNGASVTSGTTPIGYITPGQLPSGNPAALIRVLQQNNPDVLKALVYQGVLSMPSISSTGAVIQPQRLG
jgi:hypothetical protein